MPAAHPQQKLTQVPPPRNLSVNIPSKRVIKRSRNKLSILGLSDENSLFSAGKWEVRLVPDLSELGAQGPQTNKLCALLMIMYGKKWET